MATKEIEPVNYAQLPPLDARGAIALGTSLVSAMPDDMPAFVKGAHKSLAVRLSETRAAFAGAPIPTVRDRRPADQVMDRSVACLHARLDAASSLPAQHYPQATRAAELLRIVFPEGLTFLKLAYNQQWAATDEKLLRIESDGLAASIDEIAGPEYLEQVRRAHAMYGDVLGITKASPLAQSPIRAELLRALRKEIHSYVRKVLAVYEDEDERSITLVRTALQPIDELRAGASSRRTAVSDEVELVKETPVDAPAPIASAPPTASATPANGPIVAAPRAVSVPAPNGTPS